MGQEHRVVVVEREDDVLVTLRHFQIFHCLVALPAVGTYDERALRLTLTEGLVHLGHQLIPLLMVVSHRFVHELVCHGVGAEVLQHVGQLIPHVDEVLLCLLGGEEGVGAGTALIYGIEIMRADDVEIDDGTQMILGSQMEGIGQQLPCLGELVAFLIPELHLVDGDTHEIEAKLLQALEVILLDVQAALLTPLLRLRQPVAEIGSALDAEIVGSVIVLCLSGAARKGPHCCGYHSQKEE